MTPKMRLRPSASNARTPASNRPLIAASSRYGSMPLQPQIGLADEVVALQFARRAGEPDAPDLEQIGAVDDVEHLVDVLLDDEHRQAFGADAAHEVEDLLHDQRGETGGRLIH